jgi:hypothetical protein
MRFICGIVIGCAGVYFTYPDVQTPMTPILMGFIGITFTGIGIVIGWLFED